MKIKLIIAIILIFCAFGVAKTNSARIDASNHKIPSIKESVNTVITSSLIIEENRNDIDKILNTCKVALF